MYKYTDGARTHERQVITSLSRICLKMYCSIVTNLPRNNDFQPTNMEIFTENVR